jgi:hypothetical protein
MAGKVDLEEMQRYREENKHDNQGLFTFDEGDTVLYICQPCDDDATLCFVDMKQHKIAQDKPPVVCLDPEKNKILTHPRVVDYLGEDGKDIDGGCPICEAILGGTFDGDVKKAKAKTASLWNFVPIKYRKDARMPWDKRPFEVRQCAASYTVSDGIFDVFGNEGDISDPERAIFVRVQRKGTKMNDTEYTVHTDSETLRKPVRFTDEQRAIIDEALAPGGVGDLYRIVAAFTKSRADVVELLGGGGLEEETRPGKTPAGYNKGGGNKPAMSSPKPSSPKSSTPPPKGKKHQAAASQDEEAPRASRWIARRRMPSARAARSRSRAPRRVASRSLRTASRPRAPSRPARSHRRKRRLRRSRRRARRSRKRTKKSTRRRMLMTRTLGISSR